MAVHATPAALARRSTNAKITASCDALAQARSPADLDRALRVLRNLVIGHGDNKLAAAIHPHVIPALCLLLVSSDGTVPMSPADPASSIGARHRTLAAVVLGSLATGTATNSSGTPPITAAVSAQGAGDIMDVDGPVTTTTMATTATTTAQSIAEAFALHSVPRALIHALSDPDSAVATAAAAALRAVYAGHVGTLASPPPAPPPPPPPSLLPPTGSALAAAAAIPKADLYAEHPVRVLVSMIVAACEDLDAGGGVGGASGKAAEAAAAVLAASCDSPRQQQLAAACGGLSAALRLLISCSSPATTAAATAAGKGGVSRSINAARTAAAATAAVAAIVRDHRDLAIEVARAHVEQPHKDQLSICCSRTWLTVITSSRLRLPLASRISAGPVRWATAPPRLLAPSSRSCSHTFVPTFRLAFRSALASFSRPCSPMPKTSKTSWQAPTGMRSLPHSSPPPLPIRPRRQRHRRPSQQ
ncbi:hypothetical protein BC828DRAFT_6953 [Blastocladiella britannica]|nr:hypothetical protein BC828DRAFT_6953 [Blastocladiella britannica]